MLSSSLISHIGFVLSLGASSALSIPESSSLRYRRAVQPAYIDVSVATLWTDSSKPRAIDQPALSNPALIEQWLNSMNVSQYLDLTTDSRTQTQALYGVRVDILDEQNGWYEVAVTEQPTPKNSLGYPGWVPSAQVSFDTGYGRLQSSKPFALVDKAATTAIYRDAQLKSKFIEISYDTRLPVLGHTGEAIQVAVPSGGSAYLPAHEATVYDSESEIPYPSKLDLVNAAKLFVGRPYLWGGTAGFAFDCSGFTHTLYHAHGITIPRDADAQADFTGHGVRVSKAQLEAGDLLFYASNQSDPSTIYHVAMYVGNGEMAEAYDAGTPVRFTSVRFGDDYWGAERFLK
ncbi:hypothetical protein N7510_006443 [Penicillium lagena]|uniref:uncharacterized protein n=1 Tax=Penicillium lagena TaxID=94218 RepID=UPI00253F8EF4|nr:uncharacterized protein N7510_006443 [Penicillium lagena]KAJ5613249.1 hypothetical protein N7510_006443 [Penicillium lagena]